MKLIVAVDRNWAIGKNNDLLVSIPADMKFFRETTTGHTVVMGRKTLESFPGGKPLKNRINIVLSAGMYAEAGGILDTRNEADNSRLIVVGDPDALQRVTGRFGTDDVYVIGGASVYRQLLPLCDTAYVTKIDYAYDADTWFPDLDAAPDWELAERSEEQVYYDLIYHFCTYRRRMETI